MRKYYHPESPEAVALELLRMIETAEPQDRRSNIPECARLLDLYAECLAVASGEARRQHDLMMERLEGRGVLH